MLGETARIPGHRHVQPEYHNYGARESVVNWAVAGGAAAEQGTSTSTRHSSDRRAVKVLADVDDSAVCFV